MEQKDTSTKSQQVPHTSTFKTPKSPVASTTVKGIAEYLRLSQDSIGQGRNGIKGSATAYLKSSTSVSGSMAGSGGSFASNLQLQQPHGITNPSKPSLPKPLSHIGESIMITSAGRDEKDDAVLATRPRRKSLTITAQDILASSEKLSRLVHSSGSLNRVIAMPSQKDISAVEGTHPSLDRRRYSDVSKTAKYLSELAIQRKSSHHLTTTAAASDSSLKSPLISSVDQATKEDSETDRVASIDEGLNLPSTVDYAEYLLIGQRHKSINSQLSAGLGSDFITRLGSAEVIWKEQKPAKKIGPFVLGGVLGKGATAKVKEGLCSETLQRVAVKIISKKRIKKISTGANAITMEIELLRKLRHPNIIELVDVYAKVEDEGGNEGTFTWFADIETIPIMWPTSDSEAVETRVSLLKWYIVSEYCPCSLQQLLERTDTNCISLLEAQFYFKQIMTGLKYLHSQSVIHRDIKASNMLITPDRVLKISDFGVTEMFSPFTPGPIRSSKFVGTHQFLAPELASGDEEWYTEKIDIWAAGVTLYNMITGSYPFLFNEDGNTLDLYEKITMGAYSMPADIPPELVDLFQNTLQKDVAARLDATAALAHPFCVLSLTQLPSLSQSPLKAIPITNLEDNEDPSKVNIDSIPIETTMIPVLESMYGELIEAKLRAMGRLKDMGKPSGLADSPTRSTGSGINKPSSWFKNAFTRQVK